MKKGFTLIETIIAVSISFVILLWGVKFLGTYTRIYKDTGYRYLQEFYINEAFIFIEEKVKEAEEVQIYTDNKGEKSIQLKFEGENNYIRKKEGKLVISYYKFNSPRNNNIILELEEFKLEQVNNLMYVTIKNKRGKGYTRCFCLKEEKGI
ncbi:prepilin-type N-terminal cleavage/methylation domain-containing protein [Clostridium tetani]|uniref:Prepilin-type N-terminal cleavage/methylation domain-containing protein n=1 Tax=Clostridium tetani TaxID=1513 RepID=A0ABY0EPV4_CLOTA|nr:prepilin-type N-terminal cleavage/methylation domain-containing protein [Clostridium tetani]CDI49732.1 hypothetical protein BN906_01736 [Clostridium tetani 12124569]KHO38988.1 hypothetical protein OR62_08390 [Clostridium tetani]RXI38006.1 prepilin-type N-terminal cleavage/methylation domain-containing protein [Clostridium tetani]RXI52438.1 prepilin-type N-terminal cleavage/methylation domain-containing protein [Clostridium tetani]RXI70077.1 prepilin-type N-terminal cleavage/methylation doma